MSRTVTHVSISIGSRRFCLDYLSVQTVFDPCLPTVVVFRMCRRVYVPAGPVLFQPQRLDGESRQTFCSYCGRHLDVIGEETTIILRWSSQAHSVTGSYI